jgi:hypothetical protein
VRATGLRAGGREQVQRQQRHDGARGKKGTLLGDKEPRHSAGFWRTITLGLGGSHGAQAMRERNIKNLEEDTRGKLALQVPSPFF